MPHTSADKRRESTRKIEQRPSICFLRRQMLESQRDRAHYMGWLVSRGFSAEEARARAKSGTGEFRPAFVGGVRRRASCMGTERRDADERAKSAHSSTR